MIESANRMEFYLSNNPASDLERLRASLRPPQVTPMVVLREIFYDELEGVADAEAGVEIKRRRTYTNLWCSVWKGRVVSEPQGARLSLTATPDRRLKALVWFSRIAVAQGVGSAAYFFWQQNSQAYALATALALLSALAAFLWKFSQWHYASLARQEQEFLRRRLTELLCPSRKDSQAQESPYPKAA